MRKYILSSICALLAVVFAVPAHAGEKPFEITRKTLNYDFSNTTPENIKDAKQLSGRVVGYFGYNITVPRNAWYTFEIDKLRANKQYELFVDDVEMTSWAPRPENRAAASDGFVPLVNVFLTAGKHTLRLQRVGFFGAFSPQWRLKESTTPDRQIQGQLASHDVLRTGDKLVFNLSGGGAKAFNCVAMTRKAGSNNWVEAGRIDFPATALPVAKQLTLPCNEEGTFDLRLSINDNILPPYVLRADAFAVVDTRPSHAPKSKLKTKLVYDIDCVKLTNNNQKLSKGIDFWEANGATRVMESAAGKYRETAPSKLSPNSPNQNYKVWGIPSGMGFAINNLQMNKLYLAEVEYPDDARRTVNVGIYLNTARRGNAMGFSNGNSHSGYETGDWYRLSNKMRKLRMFFYADDPELRMTFVSWGGGLRAAASRIKIYQVIDGLPEGAPSRPDGRQFVHWFEEMGRWKRTFRTDLMTANGYEDEFVGIDRWLQFVRYHGYTMVNPTELVYGTTTYRSKLHPGHYQERYNAPRISVLKSEKYGLKYMPHFHARHLHNWLETNMMSKLSNHPDMYLYYRDGAQAPGSPYHPRYNPLHPNTERYLLALIKEFCDQVGDSPAFAGLSLRYSAWSNFTWFNLSSLNWGYGDWMIEQFERDTNIIVPDGSGEDRFEKRFEFLAKDPANREIWLKWRCERISELLVKIRDLLRSYQPDAGLYVLMSPNTRTVTLDETQTFATDVIGGMRETGLDIDMLRKIPGISFAPGAKFGRPKSYSRYTDQQYIAKLGDPTNYQIGRGSGINSFKLGNLYFEGHGATPVKQLGLDKPKKVGHFAASQAAGRNSLEKLSLPLAQQDTTWFVQGGARYMFPDDLQTRAWLTNYKQLPALPFTRSKTMTDPVALWSRDCPDAFYFYVVSMVNYPVKCELRLENASKLTALEDYKPVQLKSGKLQLTLQPYELLSFKTAKGAKITATELSIPPAELKLLSAHMDFTRTLAKKLASPAGKDMLNSEERQAFNSTWEIIQKEFEKTHTWRTRFLLASPPMIAAYDKTTGYPTGLFMRPNPRELDLDQTGKEKLPAGKVYRAEDLKLDNGTLILNNPLDGLCRIMLGVSGEGELHCEVGGKSYTQKLDGSPDTLIIPTAYYRSGEIKLSLTGAKNMNVYGAILSPSFLNLSSFKWATLGPFKSFNTSRSRKMPKGIIKKDMEHDNTPALEFDINGSYSGRKGKITWQYPAKGAFAEHDKVDFGVHNDSLKMEMCYAATVISTPRPVTVQLLVGTDWWANAWLNGKPVKSERAADGVKKDGSSFNTWSYTPATLKLKQGKNILVIKNHGGSAANWFRAVLSDTGNLKITAP